MSDSKFNMSGLYSIQSEGKTCTLSFGVWGGKYQLAIFRQGGAKPINVSVSAIAKKMIAEMLAEVSKGAPNARYPLVMKSYDKDARSWQIQHVLTFGKDENSVIYIEYKGNEGAPEKFPLRGEKALEKSGEQGDDGTRSKHAGDALLEFIRLQWGNAALLSRLNMPTPGAQKSSGSKPQSTPPTNVQSDDDIF